MQSYDLSNACRQVGFVHKGINLIAKLTMLGTNILKFEKFDHDFLFAFYNGQQFFILNSIFADL